MWGSSDVLTAGRAADAWKQAHEAARRARVTLRPLESARDGASVAEVIALTWGALPFPPELVRALAHSGNEAMGAFVGEKMIGCVLGWIGSGVDGPFLYSHMLATVPDSRHTGVGTALKLAQRAQALDRGLRFVRWTFDPLLARNAYLNLCKLGAIADTFEREFYGEMDDDLNRGDRSDRLTVTWDLHRKPRIREIPLDTAVALRRHFKGPLPRPAFADTDARVQLVEIPSDYHAIRSADPQLATAWRDAVATVLEKRIQGGSIISTFDRGRGAYVVVGPRRMSDRLQPRRRRERG